MRKIREEKAITLIALIITIVVLLILAVIAINAVTGDGIIQHAVNAKSDYQKAADDEERQLQNYMGILNTQLAAYKEYKVGDEITIGVEKFYVIKDSGKTEEMLTLIAKDGIDTINLVQSASANPVAFCEEAVAGYWGMGTSVYDIVEPEPTLDATGKLTLPASHIAAKAAYDYGAKVGGKGRLMKYSEANILFSENEDVLYGINGKSSSDSLDYWLGSAHDSENNKSFALIVFGSYSNDIEGLSYGISSSGNNYVVRPIVEISKNKIS